MRPVVAIIGRPNVGKSTLFNRLVGRRLALVDDRPGVTRDRREGDARLGWLRFVAVDTAGLEDAADETLAGRMRAQTEEAIRQADAVMFVMDARRGVTTEDEKFADLVRKSGKPVVLVANKAEGRGGEAGAYEAFSLGLGEPVMVSAEHGEGFGDLEDALEEALPPMKSQAELDAEEEESLPRRDDGEIDLEDDTVPADDRPRGPLRVTIVGRPNAGKSTLVNRILGEERMLTGPEAGITRDSITVDFTWRGRDIQLVDTAGLRRKARVQEKLEKLAVGDALRAIRYTEVVVVLLDATIPFEKQDLSIVDLVSREGRAIVVALNKWDLVEDRSAAIKQHREALDRLLPQIRGAQLVTVSAMTGQGIDKLMEAMIAAHTVWNTRISTARLNRWLSGVLESHPPPAVRGSRVKIRYLTQTKARPPHFILFGTRTDALPDSYVRYLINGLRETFKLPGTPIRMTFREPRNPYDPG